MSKIQKMNKCPFCFSPNPLLKLHGFCSCKTPKEFMIFSEALINGKKIVVKKLDPAKYIAAKEIYDEALKGIEESRPVKPKRRINKKNKVVGNIYHLPRSKKKKPKSFFSPPSTISRSQKKDFYDSWEWKKVRFEVLSKYGAKCMLCGATREQEVICVDHIEPLGKSWEKRFDKKNLQVLCGSCNQGKSDSSYQDFRAAK